MKSIFRVICLSAVVAMPAAAIAAEADDRTTFREAYARYQSLLEGDDDQALAEAAGRAYEYGAKIFPEDSKNVPALALNYGNALIDAGDNETATTVLLEAVEHYERVFGDEAIELIPVHMQLGNITGKVFEPRRQRGHYKRALKLAEIHYGPRSDEYGQYSLSAGVGLMNDSHAAAARPFLDDAYEILRETRGDEDPTTGYAAFQMGRYEFARRDYRDAEEHLLAALRTFEDPERPTSPLEVGAHAWLVTIYQELDEPEKGTAHCLAIGRMTPYDENQDYMPLYRRAPRYPTSALQRGEEGFADVRFTVDSQGFVQEPEIFDHDGDAAFRTAALDAVKAFRYAPRFVDGEAVATPEVETRITFKIAR